MRNDDSCEPVSSSGTVVTQLVDTKQLADRVTLDHGLQQVDRLFHHHLLHVTCLAWATRRVPYPLWTPMPLSTWFRQHMRLVSTFVCVCVVYVCAKCVCMQSV
jgi:hypothetical protein